MLAVVPALVLAAVLWRPVWDVDIFWQLKLGELILARHGPVPFEPFAATHLHDPLPAFAWAGQAALAQVRLWGGWDLLRLVNGLCWAGAFWLAAAAARARGASREMAAVALAAALLIAVPGASIRPQSLAMLAFALVLWLSGRGGPLWRRAGLIGVVLVAWQNAHPSAPVALAWFGTAAAVGWLGWLRGRAGMPGEATLLAGLAAVALVLTPDGFGYFRTAAANTAISQAFRVTEWLPLWAPENAVAAVSVGIAAIVTGVLLRRAGRMPDWGIVAPWLVLLALTVFSARLAMFWAIALIPVLGPVLPRITAPATPRWLAPALVALAIPVVLMLRPTSFRETIPVAQLEALHSTGLRGTVFAHFPWGGAVIDRGYPRWRVAFDGRYYRYPLAEWNRYLAATAGEPALARLTATYHPVAWVLSPEWTPRLIAELRADRTHWRQFSADRTAVIFVPAR